MITKRKSEAITTHKSKDKIKPKNQCKQVKKTKRETNQKLASCASKRSFKIPHCPKQYYAQQSEQNQNQNKLNIPLQRTHNTQKIKMNHDNEPNCQNHTFNLRRSASAGGIKPVKQSRKSLSPMLNKDSKQKLDIKHKYSSKPTSRSEREKTKETTKNLIENLKFIIAKKNMKGVQKIKMNRKKSQKTFKNPIHRLKTDVSSKIPQKDKQQRTQKQKNSQKKVTKSVKLKNTQKSMVKTKSKVLKQKQKEKQKNQTVFSDASYPQPSPMYSAIIPRQNFYVKMEKSQNTREGLILKACITIQRHFRGYLTRKFIEQSKYLIYCVVKIQKVWRGYIYRKRMKKQAICLKKNLSIQNSLITIKDFSEQPKQQKLKMKSFKFNNESSRKKQELQEQSNSKKLSSSKEQQQKYINILQSLLQQQGLQQKFKQKIRMTLGKQKYVKNKINSQIISQKSFNSPREVRSPRTNIVVNSPTSWNKMRLSNTQISQIHCQSPRNQISEAVFRRISSPARNKSSSTQKKKQKLEVKQEPKLQLTPFQTCFVFIEQFEFKIVDFFRDNPDVKSMFLQICQKCAEFKTYIIMSHWNQTRKQQASRDQSLLFCDICPDIFSHSFRQDIVSDSSMKIYLEDNNYYESLWLSNSTQRNLYQAFIKCIFDGLAETIYRNYKNEIITNKTKAAITNFVGNQLFKTIFMNSLTTIQGWNEYMCGAEIPVDETNPNYKQYCNKNMERLDLMVREELLAQPLQDHGSWQLWQQLNISELIYQELISEFYNQFFI